MRAADQSILSILCAVFFGLGASVLRAAVEVRLPEGASPRVQYGAERLRQALKEAGITSTPMNRPIAIEIRRNDSEPAEGFTLQTTADATTVVMGNDDSGALYGCLELARRVRESKDGFPAVYVTDAPALKLRGPCIGMQKTYILP